MKKASLLVVSTMAAGALFMAPVINKGGHVVRLSSGETVKVAFYDETSVDPTTHKSSGYKNVVVLESSTGTRIGMTTTGTRSGKYQTTIWSADGKDQMTLESDLSFRRQGLATPMTVSINGGTSKFLVESDSSGEAGKRMRKELAPEVSRLSPEFVSAVKELFRLGHSGYPNIGTGWADLLTVFDPAELAVPGAKIVSQKPMSVDDQKSIGDALRQDAGHH